MAGYLANDFENNYTFGFGYTFTTNNATYSLRPTVHH